MVYLGDNWPDEYRGKLFTLNFLGRHMNVERLEREGSGYVGKHDGDICFSADPWFRGIDLTYGPDGGSSCSIGATPANATSPPACIGRAGGF